MTTRLDDLLKEIDAAAFNVVPFLVMKTKVLTDMESDFLKQSLHGSIEEIDHFMHDFSEKRTGQIENILKVDYGSEVARNVATLLGLKGIVALSTNERIGMRTFPWEEEVPEASGWVK